MRFATYNLGKVERIIADGVEDEVLQLVDRVKQIIAEGSHRADEWHTARSRRSESAGRNFETRERVSCRKVVSLDWSAGETTLETVMTRPGVPCTV